MKPGQAITYHRNGQRQLGHLQLTDNFQWCFSQCDDRDRRVTEIELPDLSRRWKQFLDNEVLEVGHTPSPWTSGQPTTTKHVPTLADPIQRSTL